MLSFSLNFYVLPCVGIFFKFMEFTFLEDALIPGIFTHAPPESKFSPKLLPSRPRQKEITHSPRYHLFENLFPQTVERAGRIYDWPYQNSVRKYEDNLEH